MLQTFIKSTLRQNSITLGHSIATFILMSLLGWLFFTKQIQPDYNDLLSLMIGALVTIVTVMFSAVLVALQLASAQFSPRITRGFFSQNKFVQFAFYAFLFGISLMLGIKFTRHVGTGVFLYAWLPVLGALYGFFLITFVLPRFVFYISDAINVASITSRIARSTQTEIAYRYPQKMSNIGVPAPKITCDGRVVGRITSDKSGFLEMIDFGLLCSLVTNEQKCLFQSQVMVGNFISPGETLVKVTGEGAISASLEAQIRRAFVIGRFRSYEQDILFGVRQLVDIGLKAISPAVNDPTTCVNCLHYLGVIVQQFGNCSPISAAASSVPTNLLLREFTFEILLDASFDQIYQYGRTDYVVVSQILNTLYEISQQVVTPEYRAVIKSQLHDFQVDPEGFALLEHQLRIRNALARLEEILK
jgi:uncharacterized membrane protein